MSDSKGFEAIGKPPRDVFTGKNVPAPDTSWAVPGTVPGEVPPKKGGAK